MIVRFADAIDVALRHSAIAGTADLHAARQLLLPLDMVKNLTFRLPVGDKRRQLFCGDRLPKRHAPKGSLTLKIRIGCQAGYMANFPQGIATGAASGSS